MDNVIDTVDMEILMHRNVHFGGSFDVMLEYYSHEGVGVMPDFEVEEIKRLQSLEKEGGEDLAKLYLPEAAQEEIKKAQQLYKQLKEAYDEKNPKKETLLLSDLILSEEDLPEKEINALTDIGKEVVPLLIHLLSSPMFYDPLFPGYGRSPIFAAKCLVKIGDERAIPPLFEALGQDNFFTDEEIIHSLASFGNVSKSFLIKRLMQEPFSKDNEYAAMALSGFPEDEEIARISLELLEKEEIQKRPYFATYLVFACSELTKADDQKRFIALAKQDLPSHLPEEMSIVIRNWKQTT